MKDKALEFWRRGDLHQIIRKEILFGLVPKTLSGMRFCLCYQIFIADFRGQTHHKIFLQIVPIKCMLSIIWYNYFAMAVFYARPMVSTICLLSRKLLRFCKNQVVFQSLIVKRESRHSLKTQLNVSRTRLN